MPNVPSVLLIALILFTQRAAAVAAGSVALGGACALAADCTQITTDQNTKTAVCTSDKCEAATCDYAYVVKTDKTGCELPADDFVALGGECITTPKCKAITEASKTKTAICSGTEGAKKCEAATCDYAYVVKTDKTGCDLPADNFVALGGECLDTVKCKAVTSDKKTKTASCAGDEGAKKCEAASCDDGYKLKDDKTGCEPITNVPIGDLCAGGVADVCLESAAVTTANGDKPESVACTEISGAFKCLITDCKNTYVHNAAKTACELAAAGSVDLGNECGRTADCKTYSSIGAVDCVDKKCGYTKCIAGTHVVAADKKTCVIPTAASVLIGNQCIKAADCAPATGVGAPLGAKLATDVECNSDTQTCAITTCNEATQVINHLKTACETPTTTVKLGDACLVKANCATDGLADVRGATVDCDETTKKCLIATCETPTKFRVSKEGTRCLQIIQLGSGVCTKDPDCALAMAGATSICSSGVCIVDTCPVNYTKNSATNTCDPAVAISGTATDANQCIATNGVAELTSGVCSYKTCNPGFIKSDDSAACNSIAGAGVDTNACATSADCKAIDNGVITCENSVCVFKACNYGFYQLDVETVITCPARLAPNAECKGTAKECADIVGGTTACSASKCTISCTSPYTKNDDGSECIEPSGAALTEACVYNTDCTLVEFATMACKSGVCAVARCSTGYHLTANKCVPNVSILGTCATTDECATVPGATVACTKLVCTISSCTAAYTISEDKKSCVSPAAQSVAIKGKCVVADNCSPVAGALVTCSSNVCTFDSCISPGFKSGVTSGTCDATVAIGASCKVASDCATVKNSASITCDATTKVCTLASCKAGYTKTIDACTRPAALSVLPTAACVQTTDCSIAVDGALSNLCTSNVCKLTCKDTHKISADFKTCVLKSAIGAACAKDGDNTDCVTVAGGTVTCYRLICTLACNTNYALVSQTNTCEGTIDDGAACSAATTGNGECISVPNGKAKCTGDTPKCAFDECLEGYYGTATCAKKLAYGAACVGTTDCADIKYGTAACGTNKFCGVTCDAGYYNLEGACLPLVAPGGSCTTSSGCISTVSGGTVECISGTCTVTYCNPGTTKTATTCDGAIPIGSDCTKGSYQCFVPTNATMQCSGQCSIQSCDLGFRINSDATACIPSTPIGGYCTAATECTKPLASSTVACTGNVCVLSACPSKTTLRKNPYTCEGTLVIGDTTCTNDWECEPIDGGVTTCDYQIDTVTLEKSTTLRICALACKPGRALTGGYTCAPATPGSVALGAACEANSDCKPDPVGTTACVKNVCIDTACSFGYKLSGVTCIVDTTPQDYTGGDIIPSAVTPEQTKEISNTLTSVISDYSADASVKLNDDAKVMVFKDVTKLNGAKIPGPATSNTEDPPGVTTFGYSGFSSDNMKDLSGGKCGATGCTHLYEVELNEVYTTVIKTASSRKRDSGLGLEITNKAGTALASPQFSYGVKDATKPVGFTLVQGTLQVTCKDGGTSCVQLSTSESKPNAGLIAGCTVGAVVLVAGIGAWIYYAKKRRQVDPNGINNA